MSKITNDGLTPSAIGCFIAVQIWQQCVNRLITIATHIVNPIALVFLAIACSQRLVERSPVYCRDEFYRNICAADVVIIKNLLLITMVHVRATANLVKDRPSVRLVRKLRETICRGANSNVMSSKYFESGF